MTCFVFLLNSQVGVMSDGGLRLSECGTWINYSLANQNGLHGRHRTNICVVTAAGRFHPNQQKRTNHTKPILWAHTVHVSLSRTSLNFIQLPVFPCDP